MYMYIRTCKCIKAASSPECVDLEGGGWQRDNTQIIATLGTHIGPIVEDLQVYMYMYMYIRGKYNVHVYACRYMHYTYSTFPWLTLSTSSEIAMNGSAPSGGHSKLTSLSPHFKLEKSSSARTTHSNLTHALYMYTMQTYAVQMYIHNLKDYAYAIV